ncbi:hypothetical protein CVT24_003912 [Panaeolus cyanescens]|uniref:Phosphatidylinositol-specific phospholipase C X domain-containing protein n=1 Tax=Panaeolus cyanescens TaxID=181874 RepID=A0A409VVA6_9AGAR|nr:hypothetical protein CVT24_003912 [Panaeolus cyanescens]
MVPDSSKRWMTNHLPVFGNRPISELCMPGSHNAGTYRCGYRTAHGEENTVITQTKSIFDQLELGVRYLDIRPCLTSPELNAPPGNWACGNFTGPTGDNDRWQGANGVEICEVIDDINRFTQHNAELVIVNITRVYRVFIDKSVHPTGRDPNQDEWSSLISLLSTINNLFTIDRAGGGKPKALDDYTLNQFIGSGKASVVVLVSKYGGNMDDLYNHGLWPPSTLSLKGESLTEIEPVLFFEPLWSSNADSALSLAKILQLERFPWLLQEFAAKGHPSVIWMDRIENADLLTFCIATIHQRFNRSMGLNNMVIVYGGILVTSQHVHQRVRSAIDNGESFQVTSGNLGCDPWPDMDKSCAVFYEQDGIVKARFAQEPHSLDFGRDIISIQYGNCQIRDQVAYLHLMKAMDDGTWFIVNNSHLGGDPQPGVAKTCVVHFRYRNHGEIRVLDAKEGGMINFESDHEKFSQAEASSSHIV